ncbi:hypothetical protein IC582_015773 [Cucumis melo]
MQDRMICHFLNLILSQQYLCLMELYNETKDTDILVAFQVTPQSEVPPLRGEAGIAVAAESSTGTWTTLVAGEENQYIAYVAYPLDLFEEGYVTNMFTSIVGNVFGFKALCALDLEDL